MALTYHKILIENTWLAYAQVTPDDFDAEKPSPCLLALPPGEQTMTQVRLYLGGISNGGKRAFKAACQTPEQYASILALPGHPPLMSDCDCLPRLAGMSVTLFVGERDENWIEMMESTEQVLRKHGANVHLTIAAGEGHEIDSLKNPRAGQLFDLLDSWR
jgi:predicted esterase